MTILFSRPELLPLVLLLIGINSIHAEGGGYLDLWKKSKEEEKPKKNLNQHAATSGGAIDFSKSSTGTPHTNDPVEYGVDVSFPIQHAKVSQNYEWYKHNLEPTRYTTPRSLSQTVVQPLGDRQAFYDDFVNGCIEAFPGSRCQGSEDGRIAMSLRQPQSMTNYTKVGFKKIRAPPKVFELVKEFWEANKERGTLESWGTANTYTNNWKSPSYMVSVENRGLRGGGSILKQHIWDAARDTIQEWTNQELTECSLYGIRIYTEGSILSTHVDRMPLVSSAIINVAQDVDEPWPIEVYGHDGKATNVTMEPGDMVLYESHSVLHGRPFPLKGRYYANIFIHFEPVGHTLRHNNNNRQAAATEEGGGDKDKVDVHEKYKADVARGVGGHEVDQAAVAADDLPPYILPGSQEEAIWRKAHPNKKPPVHKKDPSFATTTTAVHPHVVAARTGDLTGLEKAVSMDNSIVNKTDHNGWTALHESAMAGHTDIVKYLHESGADLNARTNHGKGGTAMYLAKQHLGEDHEMVDLLESLGALDIGPDL